MARAVAAGVVVGLAAPVVLTSRADPPGGAFGIPGIGRAHVSWQAEASGEVFTAGVPSACRAAAGPCLLPAGGVRLMSKDEGALAQDYAGVRLQSGPLSLTCSSMRRWR